MQTQRNYDHLALLIDLKLKHQIIQRMKLMKHLKH